MRLAARLFAHAARLNLRVYWAKRRDTVVLLSVKQAERLTRDLARAAHYIEHSPKPTKA